MCQLNKLTEAPPVAYPSGDQARTTNEREDDQSYYCRDRHSDPQIFVGFRRKCSDPEIR